MVVVRYGDEYEYFPVEMYKTDDCTGETYSDGFKSYEGFLNAETM